MKKNTMMRIASVLLVLTLLSTCAISGTFAKYTTSATDSDTARVAKWGWQPTTITLDNLFASAYVDALVADPAADGSNTTVKSTVDVIAPGTNGSATFGFTYGGETGINAPEVDYTFEVSTTGSSIGDNIKANTNIQWKLDGAEWGTWDVMIAAIEALDGNATNNYYQAGSLPSGFNTTGANEHTISWQWIFDDATDAKDTEMGNATDLEDVTLAITVSAVQVDKLPTP